MVTALLQDIQSKIPRGRNVTNAPKSLHADYSVSLVHGR